MSISRRAIVVGLAASSAAGCAPRAMITLVPGAERVGTPSDVFVATTRTDDEGGQPGRGRSADIRFGRYTVSIPPIHEEGQIELPGRQTPDPALHFVVADTEQYDGTSGFRSALTRALRDKPRGQREAVIYVHGFNNTFADGVYRIAQIAHDLDAPAATVHYSWPSAANPLQYAYDRDSVLFARDGLVNLIRTVRASGVDQLLLVAHSVGSLLTMEALRQLDIAQPGDARRFVNGVVLFSPDIDVELFRSQALGMRALPEPFVIFTSRRDRALALSARLTGQGDRLGNIRSVDEIADLDVVLFDVSAFTTGGLNHFTLASSPTLLSLFANVSQVDTALSADQAGQAGLFPGTVLTVQNATAIILSPVTANP